MSATIFQWLKREKSKKITFTVVASNLLEEEEEEQGAGRSVQHDLQPLHAILVQLAVSLQARVDQAASVKKFYYKLFLGHPVVCLL